MVIGIVAVAGVVALGLIIWSGNRTLRSGETSSTTGNAFGPVADVFDPARSRADRELKEQENTGAVIPSPTAHDQPLIVDLASGTAKIRRPRAV